MQASFRKLAAVSVAALMLAAGAAQAADSFTNGSFTNTTPLVSGATQGQVNNNLTINNWTVPTDATNSIGYVFVFNSGASAMSGVPGQFGTVALWGTGNSGPDTIIDSPDGGNFIASDSKFTGHQQPIEQTIIGLSTGTTYTVTFDYAFAQQYTYNGDTTQQWIVDLSGDPTQSTPLFTNSEHTFSNGLTPGWMQTSFDFVAQGPSEVLSFLAAGSPEVPPFALLDGVSFIPDNGGGPPPIPGIPEPSTWALMMLGFGGLAFAGYRRAKKQAAALADA